MSMGTHGSENEGRELPIAIIGTGFAGLGMAIQLKLHGYHDFVVFESADGVGGTWRDNTYPGCACDIPSHLYSFSFERNPNWSRQFSPQAEILEYIEGCVEKYDIGPHIRFRTRVDEARWDEARARWLIETSTGERFVAKVLVGGTGPLRVPNKPDIEGLESFDGAVFHSAEWDHDYDFEAKRVAVIGTGASALQFIPQLAPQVASLHVFQRTAPWVLPKPDAEVPESWRAAFRAYPALTRAWRAFIYGALELLGTGFFVAPRLNEWRQEAALEHIHEHIADPALRAKLTPDYRMGCKRVLLSNDYYQALARDNVDVIASGVTEVRGNTVVASDGTEREVDAIVLGTGFRVLDFLAPLKVYGRGGVELTDAWRDGAEAYYGVSVTGYPNLFVLVGPNSGLGHNSIVFMIEAQVHYILQCLERMDRDDLASLEVLPEAQRAFNAAIHERLGSAIWAQGGCRSWYLDENGKNVTLWPGYTAEYWLRTRRVNFSHFERVTRAELEARAQPPTMRRTKSNPTM